MSIHSRWRRATGSGAAWAALLALVSARALGPGIARSVHAETATIQQYQVPTQAYLDPADITNGPDGNLWFTEFSGQNIGRITPGGSMNEYALSGNPTAVVRGGDGDVWFVESDVQKIGKVDPATGIVTGERCAGRVSRVQRGLRVVDVGARTRHVVRRVVS